MSGGSDGQRRTTPDTEPQASQATRQTRPGASWLRDEEVWFKSSHPTVPLSPLSPCHKRARTGTELRYGATLTRMRKIACDQEMRSAASPSRGPSR
jgi:hypothetical protein